MKAPAAMPPQAAPPMRSCLRTKRVGDLGFGVVGCGKRRRRIGRFRVWGLGGECDCEVGKKRNEVWVLVWIVIGAADNLASIMDLWK